MRNLREILVNVTADTQTVGQIRGREYVIFLFDRQGTPKMPYNLEKGGKPKAVDQSRWPMKEEFVCPF